jgi:hypothetical protein
MSLPGRAAGHRDDPDRRAQTWVDPDRRGRKVGLAIVGRNA